MLLRFVLGKIVEFNAKAGDSSNKLEQSQLESLVKICNENSSPDEQLVKILITLLDWPKSKKKKMLCLFIYP